MYNPYPYLPYMGGFNQQANISPPTSQMPLYGLIKVNGMDGAKAYQMPPSAVVALFDANEDFFYIKSSDGAGFSTIKTFRFTPYTEESKPSTEYVTKGEFEQFRQELMTNAEQYIRKSKTTKQSTGNDTQIQ